MLFDFELKTVQVCEIYVDVKQRVWMFMKFAADSIFRFEITFFPLSVMLLGNNLMITVKGSLRAMQ